MLAVVIGLIGLPFTLWTVLRVLWPDVFLGLRARARIGVLLTVAAIAVASSRSAPRSPTS